MPDAQTCPQCGAPLPSQGWQGLCPKCLVHVSLEAKAEGETQILHSPAPSATEQGVQSSPKAETPTGATLIQNPPSPQPDLLPERTGIVIGRYKLLQQIGEGGFGVVFMAEQTEPLQRKVALKIIKAGMDTREIIARFEAERQALALMDHPNIAKVLDAGATASGRPYFVMELVRGVPLTDYCDHAKLSTRERLELFIKVCHAVQHAHQKGVIHRDLKPGNVLVTLHDGEPVPKVIDFGVAKALGQKLTDKTLFTRFEQMIGTPAYMSPEQAALGGLDIDTRSDIYSLGVLLYELLTGVTPLDQETLRQGALDEIRRMIRETDPPKPSTRVLTLGERLAEVAKCRHADATSLRRLIRGDLDWITMKALEKDRRRRYETANGLAMDIERHLRDEAVIARPPSGLYRFEKFVRRNRVAFSSGVLVALALLVGAAISTWQAIRATRAEHEQTRLYQQSQMDQKQAKTEAFRSQQVARLLTETLQGVEPSVALGRDTTMLREILDRTAERVDRDLQQEPEVQVEIQGVLADVYHDLGLYVEMASVARASLSVTRAKLGGTNSTLASALARLGDALLHLGELDQAEALSRQALMIRQQLFGPEHQVIASSLDNLANILREQGKLGEAERLFKEELAMRNRLSATNDIQTATALNNFALVLNREGRLEQAEEMERSSLAMRRKLQAGDDPGIATCLGNLAAFVEAEGQLSEAEELLHEALALQRRLRGNENAQAARLLESLASVLRREGKTAEAESTLRDALVEHDVWSKDSAPPLPASHLAVTSQAQVEPAGTLAIRIIPGWGVVSDPDGDCAVTNENEKLSLTIPGIVHDLKTFKANAPRVLRKVTGDFTVQVKVSADFEPGNKTASTYSKGYNGAGLLLWGDDRNFVRLERNVWVTAEGARYSYTPLLEYVKDGNDSIFGRGTSKPFFKGRSTYLRMTRRGDALQAALSHDGLEWVETDPIAIRFPKDVKVGFVAINTSIAPFTVEFSELQLALTSGN